MRYGKDDRVCGTAAQALLDRGWGKPKVEVVSEAGGSYLKRYRLPTSRSPLSLHKSEEQCRAPFEEMVTDLQPMVPHMQIVTKCEKLGIAV